MHLCMILVFVCLEHLDLIQYLKCLKLIYKLLEWNSIHIQIQEASHCGRFARILSADGGAGIYNSCHVFWSTPASVAVNLGVVVDTFHHEAEDYSILCERIAMEVLRHVTICLD